MVHIQSPVPHSATAPTRAGPAAVTLQDVMDRVAASPAVTKARRAEMLSALRTAARCIGSDPGDIAAHPAALRKMLKDAPHLLAGVSKRRWAAVRYLTLAALGVAGFKMMPGRHRHLILSPAWENLRRLAPGRHNGIGLSRFMSFCSAAGIEPGGVDLALFLRYRQELENNSLLRKAGFVYRTTCVLWNRASKSISEWPKLEIAVPSASRRYSLDWSAFPASFQADVDAFLANAGNQDPLADDFAPSVRPATILGRRKQIQQMATAFVASGASGASAATLTGLATLVQADNAKKVLTFFLNRPTVGHESVYALAVLLRTIARHWVPRDEENIRKLEKFCKNLPPKKPGMTDKNRALLRQFDDPRNLDALVALPAKLVRETQRRDAGAQWELQGILYAVAIELLLVAPIRIKNLTLLDIDRHIIQSRRGAQTVIHIVIPGEEVKNGVPFEVVLPKASGELLSLYLKTYRPRISDQPSPWLFPNPAGGPRNIVRFGGHISETISRHTGLKMHPHLFRHLSVKLLLEVHPEGIETARLLLGHKSLRTTQRAYSEGKTAAAYKHYEAIIVAKRNPGGGRPPKKPRPWTGA